MKLKENQAKHAAEHIIFFLDILYEIRYYLTMSERIPTLPISHPKPCVNSDSLSLSLSLSLS